MSFKESLLRNSNTFNYYKQTSESLLLKNKELIKVNNQLKKDLESKEKDINFLKEEIQSLKKLHEENFKLLTQNDNEEINTLKIILTRVNTLVNDSFIRFNHYKKITGKNDAHYRQINNELKYAFVFNDTIKESNWLVKKDFSLVNSAANYSFIYFLYRILNDTQPNNILELGMGQTTKLTSQFANYFKDSKLTILEGDQDWIDNFSEQLNISENINIFHRNLEMFKIEETENLRFKNVLDVVGDEKFDLIIIDGPQGFVVENGVNKDLEYSRSNILELIPNNLADDFIIIIDDYNRLGEQNTISKVKDLLSERNIGFYEYSCEGLKRQYAIFTEKYKYLAWI